MATPLEVYRALTAAGASTTQAVGIMANIINESSFDPEAIGDQGTSFGIVQEHGSQYSTLVTGNPAADLRAQVSLLTQQGGFIAASGATPEQAAGNFAANYEKCKGCEQGGAQWLSRVGNVSTVMGWVTSGRWPKSAGSPSPGGTVVGGDTGPGSGCLLVNPFSTSLPLIGNISAGPSCLFSKTQARALIGGALLAGSGLVFLVGSLVLASYGLKGTAAGRAAGQAAGTVAGAVPVAGAPVRAARKAAGGVRKAAGQRKAARPGSPARAPATATGPRRAAPAGRTELVNTPQGTRRVPEGKTGRALRETRESAERKRRQVEPS